MKDALIGLILRVTPKNLLSFLVGKLVHARLPWPFASLSVRWFARRYRINMSEAEHPIEHYGSIGELFTRHLKSELRPIGEGAVHPVDGRLTQSGYIRQGQLYQLKGWPYSITELLQDPKAVEEFEGGVYLTYYLCPTDYHRVHSPIDGEIEHCLHVSGKLWPVNPWSVRSLSRLFAINERVVVRMKTPKGPVALVMVGATNVGRMSMSFDPDIVTNTWSEPPVRDKTYNPPIPVKKGDELGVFNMGSTVVMMYPKGFLEGPPRRQSEQVRLGESYEGQKDEVE